MIELRYLGYFIAVAETGHFRRAAERLHLTQPALSQQIAKLEQALGVQLFERNRHQVALTHAGELFLVEARKVLEQADHAVHIAQRAARGEVGELSIGYIGSVLYGFLPRTIQLFQERYPEIELKLQELSSSRQIAQLQKQTIDVGVLYAPVHETAIQVECILRPPVWIAVPARRRLARRERVSLPDLAQEPVLLPSREEEPALHDHLMGLFQQAGYVPNVVQEASQIQTLLGLVALGIGLYPVPGYMRNMHHEGIVYVPLEEPGAHLELSMAWRREDKSPALQHYLAIVREVVSYNLQEKDPGSSSKGAPAGSGGAPDAEQARNPPPPGGHG